jgi:hypothetical protein
VPFRIEKKEDFIEVHLWGNSHESEVVEILWKVHEMAPRKEISDLWLLSEDCVVPWGVFPALVKQVGRLVSPDFIGSKSAIVVVNHFQMAQAKLYLEEAKGLPYETGVFMTREEALRWLKT